MPLSTGFPLFFEAIWVIWTAAAGVIAHRRYAG